MVRATEALCQPGFEVHGHQERAERVQRVPRGMEEGARAPVRAQRAVEDMVGRGRAVGGEGVRTAGQCDLAVCVLGFVVRVLVLDVLRPCREVPGEVGERRGPRGWVARGEGVVVVEVVDEGRVEVMGRRRTG